MKATLYLLSLMLTVSLLGQPCNIDICCPPRDCNCGDWEARYMYIILAPPEYPDPGCAIDVRYRVRRCYGPSAECDHCEVELDWIWPVCEPCSSTRTMMTQIIQEIYFYGLRNTECQPFGGQGVNEGYVQIAGCWRETQTPPPDLPSIPIGWQLPEKWLVPCLQYPERCCARIQPQGIQRCSQFIVQPPCNHPDCPIPMCCPP
jgi:hypothetical protein